jgi:uncharacterized damage-inducible protein DinB
MMSNKQILIETKEVLLQTIDIVSALSFDEYTAPIPALSGGTIGQHNRHIIELFQQLIAGCESKVVNYDNRKRDLRMHTDIDYAIDCIADVISKLERDNLDLRLETSYNNFLTSIETNYFRELIYNIEHCVHHQALIKVALLHLGRTEVKDDFGVAKSTLIYREKCAQ